MLDKDLMDHIVQLHLGEGRTYKSLSDEYGVSANTIGRAVKRFRDHAKANKEKAKQLADLERLRKLELENAELKKENDFLKRAAAFFAKENN